MRVWGRHAVDPAVERSRHERAGRARRPAFGVLVAVAAGVVALGALSVMAVAVAMARSILVPPTSRDEDTDIVAVDHRAGTITFSRSPDAIIDGRYSFWFTAAKGHARIGTIVSESEHTVTRQLLGVDFGNVDDARKGRFNGWFYLYPSDLGTDVERIDFESVEIDTELGTAPAWLVRPDPAHASTGANRWVIQVHGRAVMRAETIRAIPVFRDAGYTSLLISYRNDFEAPSSPDGRYSLGDTEWKDVDAAIAFAKANGARSVVLMGWSMGGATVLQTVNRSSLASLVTGLVLESPVIDWVDALDFQGRSKGIIRPLRAIVYSMIGRQWGRPFTGLMHPIDLRRLDFVRRAEELRVPILILHSDDDGYVPSTASRALAEARLDIVTLEVFQTARHTKLWNYDPERWTRAIADWLAELTP